MSQPTLTPHQLKYLDVFGYLVFPGLLNDRINTITEEFEAVFANRPVHDGKERSTILPFVDQSEYLSSLIDDPRVDGIFTSLLGPDYNYLGSDGNFYVGDSSWHSDTDWSGKWRGKPPRVFYKLALYLDPVTAETGALRVIPGSHRYGDRFAEDLHDTIRHPEDTLGMRGSQVPAIALESRPGDVVVFNQNTKHSSWGGSSRRRMFTINATARYAEAELPLLQNEVASFARFWPDAVYGAGMLRNAGPERRVHLEQAMALDAYLAAEVAKAKTSMTEPARR